MFTLMFPHQRLRLAPRAANAASSDQPLQISPKPNTLLMGGSHGHEEVHEEEVHEENVWN
jgi:hypothetical protein